MHFRCPECVVSFRFFPQLTRPVYQVDITADDVMQVEFLLHTEPPNKMVASSKGATGPAQGLTNGVVEVSVNPSLKDFHCDWRFKCSKCELKSVAISGTKADKSINSFMVVKWAFAPHYYHGLACNIREEGTKRCY
ncbi:hypothetical protein T265_12111 [Opisthorchis viverrini]|uniref:Uncharacterized protein n=1 Tax=Opisthorchis viverrini TaxID=6198 RepID=A0A074Z091_OPIVI|nr:hypothetical protein T265_12111 [Opisthorchis viverrini]KER18892.1 hypothetical protein T265_12111 [Opisthorchis viverrini]